MLGLLTEKMQGLLARVSGKHQLSEKNIADAVREVRIALLEADVNYSVVKTFIQRVKEKALGDRVMRSVSPGQQFIKVIHDELVELMGKEEEGITKGSPTIIMMCGLQGSGKTTQCAKLANYLVKNKQCKRPLIAACDLQRPAAVLQLQNLGKQIEVPVFTLEGEKDPTAVARQALKTAHRDGHDLLIVDTAGRLHIDDLLMQQLEELREILKPTEILFVANAATGQDAVNISEQFNKRLAITGTILTMLDGNTRGGAAISIREVTGKPLKFEGIGERIEDIQLFNPASMADRILGMGDTINLVRKAKEHIDDDQAEALEKKIRTATFTYKDYLNQIKMVKKMGSLKGLLKMIPGMSNLPETGFNDQELVKVEAILKSMTADESEEKKELIVPRRKRIAKGSGTTLDDVNRLVKSFKNAKKLFKNMPKNMKNMQKMMGGAPWG